MRNSHLKDNVRNVMLTKCHSDINMPARSYVNTSIKLGSQTLQTTLISFWCRTTSIKCPCACAMDTKIKHDACDSLLKFCLYCLGSYNKNSTVLIINNNKYIWSLFLNMKTVYNVYDFINFRACADMKHINTRCFKHFSSSYTCMYFITPPAFDET